jgi:hypothetical protein
LRQSSERPTLAECTTVSTSLSGYDLLNDPLLNKGTAFTEAERDAFDLHGLLPPNIGVLDEQLSRRLQVFRSFGTDLERYSFLLGLHDANETLFFALVVRNIEEMLPIVYTPTIGAGCQQFSRLFRKPRGLFLSLPHKKRLKSGSGDRQGEAQESRSIHFCGRHRLRLQNVGAGRIAERRVPFRGRANGGGHNRSARSLF